MLFSKFQGSASPETSTVYVDTRALRNDRWVYIILELLSDITLFLSPFLQNQLYYITVRVTLVEKGSPHSVCLQESGKILPGVKVVIANPESKGMLGDSHLGEVSIERGGCVEWGWPWVNAY